MDDLVMQKLIALHLELEKMYWRDRLQEVIDQLEAEIVAEHGFQQIDGSVRQAGIYSPETCLIISACS